MDQRVLIVVFLVAPRPRCGRHQTEARHDLEVVRIAAELVVRARLHVLEVFLAGVDRQVGGEDHLGEARGDVHAVVGGAGLHDHRAALRRRGTLSGPRTWKCLPL